MLFLGISQSSADTIELSQEELEHFKDNYFEDVEGDQTPQNMPPITLQNLEFCNSIEVVKYNLVNEYNEVAVATGEFTQTIINRNGQLMQKTGRLYFYSDPIASEYTVVVEYEEDGIACVIGSGKRFRPYSDDEIEM